MIEHGRNRERTSLIRVSRALGILGLACWGWVGWSLADAAMVEAYQGRELDHARSELNRELAGDTTLAAYAHPAAWTELEEGDLVGRIRIPELDISAIVLAGSEPETLDRAVGHMFGTALPGVDGNVALAGHRTTFFRKLGSISTGDIILMETPHGDVYYRVDTTFVVEPEDVWVLNPPAHGEMITLITCFPFDFVGPAPQRFIVQGHRIDVEPRLASVTPAPF